MSEMSEHYAEMREYYREIIELVKAKPPSKSRDKVLKKLEKDARKYSLEEEERVNKELKKKLDDASKKAFGDE